jgi:hypothetical protein
LQASLGRSGFIICATANQRDSRLGVEIYLNGSDAKERFRQLEAQRADIEALLGYSLDWQELPDANACRVVLYHANCPLDDESRWEEYLGWMVPIFVKFDSVFRPVIKALP